MRPMMSMPIDKVEAPCPPKAAPPVRGVTWLGPLSAFILVAWALSAVSSSQTGSWEWTSLTRYAFPAAIVAAGLAAGAIIGLAALVFRQRAENRQTARILIEAEERVAEARHRAGNAFAVISATLALEARRLEDSRARRALRRAGGRIQVMADIGRELDRTASADVRVDAKFLGGFVSARIDAASASERVRHETTVDPIDLPKAMLTPLMLVLDECVVSAIEHGAGSEARGVIRVRLEGGEPGKRRLIVADDWSGDTLESEDAILGRGASLPFVNALAAQLNGSFQLENIGEIGARAVLAF